MKVFESIRNTIRYSLVTPARNEEAIIDQTVQSVINQTLKPQKWIILEDGSIDRTGEILDSYSKDHKWIEIIHVEKEVPSYEGAQQKLYLAFDRIDIEQNDFVGKLDADIELGPTYFEDLLRKFIANPKLGMAGGSLFYIIKGKKLLEENPEDHVRGGLKLYRAECWKDIGGMEFKLGYDTIDEVKANMFGWETRTYSDLTALHHRPTGQEKGTIGSFMYQGKVAYLVGYHPLFLIGKSLKEMTSKPYLLNGLARMLGFARCYIRKTERSIDDPEFIRYLRKKQIKRLLRIPD